MANYQPSGIDAYPPSEGIEVFHVDESVVDGNSQLGYPGQSCWPWNGEHYSVALLAANGEYNLEQNVYNQDDDSCFVSDGVSILNATTSPPTNQYHYGYGVKKTGISIEVLDTSANCMNVSAH